ncbi:MAG TPA: MFS transporter [Stellaceae bacterium]|jgi:MFS family permease|nr:MFS transporter [Stellaceae bacterium]
MNRPRRKAPFADAQPPPGASAAARTAWLLLAGAFAAFTVSAGLMHSYAVFLVAFIQAFAWSRAETSVAYSVSQLVAGASSPLVGALVDRLGPLRLLLLGSSLLIVGLVGCSHMASLWQVIILYGVVMTFGANCLGLVVFVPLLSRRFVRRRGMAISVVQSANGFARAVSAPLVQFLISAVGWRETYLVQAGFMAVMVVPLAVLIRRGERAPPSAPPQPDRAVPAVGAAPAAPPGAGWTLAEAVRTPHFWLLFAVYLFTGLGSFLVSLHQLAFAVDRGFDKLYAAEVLGMGSFLAIAGTIFTGSLSDYIGREWAAILAYGISILGVVCALFITNSHQGWLLWLFACLFGLTWGARGPAITAKTADLFPGRQLGTILGVITIGSGIGSAAGSWAAGWIFDVSGSYEVAFILSIVAYACGCVAFWALRRPPARRQAAPAR